MANDINFDDIPVCALRSATRNVLATLLNPTKVIPSPSGLPRDWRGLDHLTGEKVTSQSNPVEYILQAWEKSSSANLGQLQSFLAQLDRYDVLDDTREMMCADAENYLRKSNTKNELSTSRNSSNVDDIALTRDDVCRRDKGLPLQLYDAFLLYVDEDEDFAMQIVDNLENKYELKLCFKDRDLLGGITFEHDAIMKLIANRCDRLIVVVSPSFLNSSAKKFFVTFAQALAIEQRQRKVVPCLYTERFDLPYDLKYYVLLDYARAGKRWDFWEKLYISIRSCELTLPEDGVTLNNCCGVTLKEIESNEEDITEFNFTNQVTPRLAIKDVTDSKSSCKNNQVMDDTTDSKSSHKNNQVMDGTTDCKSSYKKNQVMAVTINYSTLHKINQMMASTVNCSPPYKNEEVVDGTTKHRKTLDLGEQQPTPLQSPKTWIQRISSKTKKKSSGGFFKKKKDRLEQLPVT